MEKVMKFSVILGAVDKMSKVIQYAGNEAVKTLKRVKKEADAISKSAFDFGRNAVVVGAAVAAPLIAATQQAVAFEDKMADVAKVMNLQVGSAEFKAMGEEAKKAAIQLKILPDEAAGLMAALAQGGVVKEELQEVTRIAGQMGVAFGLPAELAGERFIKMKNALGETTKATKVVADAINHLSDNSAAKATDILDFMAAGGAGVANTLKLRGQAAAAFGATLISMGKSGAESATIMERFQKGVLSNVELRTTFEKAGGGAEGLLAVLKKAENLSGAAKFEFFQNFGEYGTAIMQLSQNGKLLNETLALVADNTSFADSVMKEFQNRNSTTAGKLKALRSEAVILAISIGEVLIPPLLEAVKAIQPIVKSVGEWIAANPELTQNLVMATAALAGLSLAMGAGAFLVGGITKSWSIGASFVLFFTKKVDGATKAQKLLNAVMKMNPAVRIAMIVLALAGAIAFAWNNFDGFRGAVKGLWAAMKQFGNIIKQYVIDRIKGLLSGISGVGQALALLFDGKFSDAWSVGKQAVSDLTGVSAAQKANQSMGSVGGAFKQAYRAETGGAALMPAGAGVTKPAPIPNASTGNTSVQYAPNVTFNGSYTPQQRDEFVTLLNKHKDDVARVVSDSQARNARTAF